MQTSSRLSNYRKAVTSKLAELEHCKKQCRQERSSLEESEHRGLSLRSAISLAQTTATTVQEHAHKRVADIVSRSLETVFDEPYQFKIKFEERRGRTEASLVFERNGMEVDPMTASGGGVVDVAAFALRLSYLLLSQPPLRRLIVMDEPFKFLSKEYIHRAALLVESLAKDLDCQFLIVTHHEDMKLGTVIRL